MPMNPAQARLIDQVLTNHAIGYTNSEMIGHHIFPRVPIPARGAKVIKFGKEGFRLRDTRRAPGASRRQVQFGFASDPVTVFQEALDASVPIEVQEEAARGPDIDILALSVNTVLDSFALSQEHHVSKIARDPASYSENSKEALTGTSLWTSASSDPEKDIDDAKDQIRGRIGRNPNLLTLSPKVFKALKRHPKIKEHFKYTSSKSVTEDMLATYFDIEKVIVGRAVELDAEASADADATDVWGNDAILSFSPQSGSSYLLPSFGYTYMLKGGTFVRKGWFDQDNDSWRAPVNQEWNAYLTGADAGFLFQAPAG